MKGEEISDLSATEMLSYRREMQMIFQDPYASLNPRMTIRDIVAAPLEIAGDGHRKQQDARVAEMLEHVGLNPEQAMDRRPHEFSGGQCQRISIARALILRPDLLVCDETRSRWTVSSRSR